MDPFEKKLKDLYQEKRRLDEQSIPAFNTFLNNRERPTAPSRFGMAYKMVATIAAITIPAILILLYFNNSKRSGQPTRENSTVGFNQPLPTQSLLNSVNSNPNIWHWKAPTDQLLQDAYKSMNTRRIKKS